MSKTNTLLALVLLPFILISFNSISIPITLYSSKNSLLEILWSIPIDIDRPAYVVWSPNGKYIAVCGYPYSGGVEVFLYNGTNIIKLWYRMGPYFAPCIFSPDSRYILVTYSSGSWYGVSILDIRTGEEVKLQNLYRLKSIGYTLRGSDIPYLVTWVNSSTILIVFLKTKTIVSGYSEYADAPVVHAYIAQIVGSKLEIRELEFKDLEEILQKPMMTEYERCRQLKQNGTLRDYVIRTFIFGKDITDVDSRRWLWRDSLIVLEMLASYHYRSGERNTKAIIYVYKIIDLKPILVARVDASQLFISVTERTPLDIAVRSDAKYAAIVSTVISKGMCVATSEGIVA